MSVANINQDDVTEVAAADDYEHGFKFFDLLQALRKYVGASVKELTKNIPTAYYRLNPDVYPKHTFIKSQKTALHNFVSSLRKKVRKNPDLDLEVFNKMADILLQVYEDEYSKHNKSLIRECKQAEAAAEERAQKFISKQEELKALADIDNYYELLKALRDYFGLSQSDVGKILEPNNPLSKERVRQYEDSTFNKTNPLNHDRIKRLVSYYRELAVANDDNLNTEQEIDFLKERINRLYRLWEKEKRSCGNNVYAKSRAIANKNSEEFKPYLAYLIFEAGYNFSNTGLSDFFSTHIRHKNLLLDLDNYNNVLEKLYEPDDVYGRRITEAEFAKLDELYLKHVEQHPRQSAKKECALEFLRPSHPALQFRQFLNFEQLVIDSAKKGINHL